MAYLKSIESALSFVKACGRARESHLLSRPVALNSIRIHSWGYLEDEEYLETKLTSWTTCTCPAPPGLDAEAQAARKTQPACAALSRVGAQGKGLKREHVLCVGGLAFTTLGDRASGVQNPGIRESKGAGHEG